MGRFPQKVWNYWIEFDAVERVAHRPFPLQKMSYENHRKVVQMGWINFWKVLGFPGRRVYMYSPINNKPPPSRSDLTKFQIGGLIILSFFSMLDSGVLSFWIQKIPVFDRFPLDIGQKRSKIFLRASRADQFFFWGSYYFEFFFLIWSWGSYWGGGFYY